MSIITYNKMYLGLFKLLYGVWDLSCWYAVEIEQCWWLGLLHKRFIYLLVCLVYLLDLMSFDDVSATSEKLSHPTANRPKMPGRRLPAQFGGNQSVSKTATVLQSAYTSHINTHQPTG